jgi:hypothetical protein
LKAEKRTQYINKSTGEVFEKRSLVDLQFDEQEGYLFWNRKSAVRTFTDAPLPSAFTWAEKGRIYELKNFMLRDSQMLVYKSNGALKPVDIRGVCRICDMSERYAKELVKKMKRHGIMKEVEIDGSTYFVMNPIYFLKVKRITLTMYLIFQEELKQVLPEWVIAKFLYQAKEIKPKFRVIGG